MSDRVVVMHQGQIQQVGDPWTLYHRPANGFVATFVGDANLINGPVTQVGSHRFTVALPTLGESIAFDVQLDVAGDRPHVGQEVSVVFRPEWVSLADEGAPADGRNQIPAELLSSEFLGSHFGRRYRAGEHTLRVQAVTGPTSQPPRIGGEQVLVVPPGNVTWFPAEGAENAIVDDDGSNGKVAATGSHRG